MAYVASLSRCEALGVEFVGLHEGGEVVGVGGGHYMLRIFVELEVGLFANAVP